MLKITADTNILVSAAIVKGNEFKLLKAAKSGKIKLILSPKILREFVEVISRQKFGFSQEQVFDAFRHIVSISSIVTPSIQIDAIKEDPKDNMVLECAITGNVDYIVSGDEHLLKLRKYKNIKIIRTQNILELISNH